MGLFAKSLFRTKCKISSLRTAITLFLVLILRRAVVQIVAQLVRLAILSNLVVLCLYMELFDITGIKIYETTERELVMEPAIKWAGNQNITVAIKLLSQRITVQVKLQISHIVTYTAL